MTSQQKKAWSYFAIAPLPTELAVPLDDVKSWLKVTGSSSDDEITALIKSATATAEKLTKRDLIEKKYRTFRDAFSDYERWYGNYAALVPRGRRVYYSEIELRKSKLQSVDLLEYLKDDVWTTVSSDVYYSTEEADFSSILLTEGQSWPSDLDNRDQAVKIELTAGYGPDADSIPEDIKTAIKMHVVNAFQNRGDCMKNKFLPAGASAIYQQYRIMDMGI